MISLRGSHLTHLSVEGYIELLAFTAARFDLTVGPISPKPSLTIFLFLLPAFGLFLIFALKLGIESPYVLNDDHDFRFSKTIQLSELWSPFRFNLLDPSRT